ncbi:MAG TPA: hypothetical protein VFM66_11755 [Agromyces sp.]|nr:hypothetical protein [Agromyces sp.]
MSETEHETPLVETGESAPEQAQAEALQEHIETVATEAKQKFTLRERLSGFKHRTKKVALFLDLEIMQAVTEAKMAADAIFAEAERPGIEAERRRELLDAHHVALDAMEQITESMKESIAAAHITTMPGPAAERAARKARRRIAVVREVMTARAADKDLPEEQREAAEEWLLDEAAHFQDEVTIYCLALGGLSRLAFHDGDMEVDLDGVRALHETLPTNQWQDLRATFESLMFDEQIARAAVDEPGFSQGS